MKLIKNNFAAFTATSALFVMALLPFMAAAQTGIVNNSLSKTDGFGGFVAGVTDLINNFLIPFLIALAVLAFIYGVFTYFIAGGADEDKRASGRSLMLYAIIGFVAIVALWGIVNFLTAAFGFDSTGTVTAPSGPTI